MCLGRSLMLPQHSDKWHSLLLLNVCETVPHVLNRFQSTSEYANIWGSDSGIVEDSIILGYDAASEHNWLPSGMATYPTQERFTSRNHILWYINELYFRPITAAARLQVRNFDCSDSEIMSSGPACCMHDIFLFALRREGTDLVISCSAPLS
jgi:hypothetical protein